MIATVRRVVLKPRTGLACLGWTIVAIAAPLFARLALDAGRLGSVFAFVYPAVLASALLLGWRWGAVVALVGELCAIYFLKRPGITRAEYLQELPILVVASTSMALVVLTAELLRRALQQSESLLQRSELRGDELIHRNKNSLQLIQALAWHAKQFSDPASFYDTLTARIAAMGRANELLRFGADAHCRLSEVIATSTGSFDDTRIQVQGPDDCWIDREAVVPLSMCIHELCTNATKYGALSTAHGQVTMAWSVRPSHRDPLIVIDWKERDGPAVSPPATEGMGLLLLRPQGDIRVVDIDFAPDGLHCIIEVKAAPDR